MNLMKILLVSMILINISLLIYNFCKLKRLERINKEILERLKKDKEV
ncbi:hypothetical protein ES703_34283 [subsurface metagenome]